MTRIRRLGVLVGSVTIGVALMSEVTTGACSTWSVDGAFVRARR